MRLSDAEREAVLEALSAHSATGRLDVAELEARVERVLGAQTHEEAAAAVADLPPLADVPAGWQPTRERFRDPRSGRITRVWVDAAGARHYIPE